MDRGSVRHENAKEAVIFIDPMSLGYKYFQIHSIIENLFPHLSPIHHLNLSFFISKNHINCFLFYLQITNIFAHFTTSIVIAATF